jgi:hypothetical protein
VLRRILIRVRAITVIAAVAAIAVALAANAAGDVVSAGRLAGRTQITYGCPGPVRVGEPPCERWSPFPRARFAVTTGGTRRVVTSDARGRFRLSLAPGTYTLLPLPQRRTKSGRPVTVHVRSGETTSALVRFLGVPMML